MSFTDADLLAARFDPLPEDTITGGVAPTVEDPEPLPALRDSSGLLEWQPLGVQKLVRSLRRSNFALDASDAGVGKTCMALAAARELGRPVMVIGPKIAKSAWRYWAKEMGVQLRAVESYEKVRYGTSQYGNWVSNKPRRDFFQWDKGFIGDSLVVLDECHKCRAVHSQLSDMLIDARHQDLLLLLASATMVESPLHLKALGYLLGWHKVFDFYMWAGKQHCSQGQYGWRYRGSAVHMAGLHSQIFPKFGNRIRIKDLGDKFPSTTIEAVAVPIDAGDRNSIQAVYKELSAERKKGPLPLAAQIKFRMTTEMAKVKVLAEMAKAHLENGLSVVIFMNFTTSLLKLAEMLNASDMVINGDTPEWRRQEIEAIFQANKRHVVLANMDAGGQAISFHDLLQVRRRATLLSPSNRAVSVKQALGRVPRAGGTHSLQQIVFAEDTIEVPVCDGLRRKLKFQQAFNDGDLFPEELF